MNRALLFGIVLAFVNQGVVDSAFAQDSKVEKKSNELKWLSYSDKAFEKNRFSSPTVLAIMKDLCPG